MTPSDQVLAVQAWQAGPYMPLNCGKKTAHGKLNAIINGMGEAVMVCPNCDYVQRRIPEVICEWYRDTQGEK